MTTLTRECEATVTGNGHGRSNEYQLARRVAKASLHGTFTARELTCLFLLAASRRERQGREAVLAEVLGLMGQMTG